MVTGDFISLNSRFYWIINSITDPLVVKQSILVVNLDVLWFILYTCLLLLILMLWHRQAIFESKGDKLSSSAECRIRLQGLRHQIASRLNACWQTDWAIEDQAKNLNSTARPYDQRAFSPINPTVGWLLHLALAIYMFVVVNLDALAQTNNFWTERRQVVFLCWMQDSNPRSLKQNSYIFIKENAFENSVCEMAAVLSRPQCVNQPVESTVIIVWWLKNNLQIQILN